jgi:hypothetical protein
MIFRQIAFDLINDDLRKDGIAMVAPHRSNRRKCATQDGRQLWRYARRWLTNGSSPGFNGSDEFLSAGSSIRRISLAS